MMWWLYYEIVVEMHISLKCGKKEQFLLNIHSQFMKEEARIAAWLPMALIRNKAKLSASFSKQINTCSSPHKRYDRAQ